MNISVQVILAIGVLSFAGIVLMAYQRRQQHHVQAVEQWIEDYLRTRYGKIPAQLHIHDCADRLFPVLVRFDLPGIGLRHSMQFECSGSNKTWSLISERDEQR